LDIHELPTDWRDIRPDRVYYIVFADDLSLFSLNLQLLEQKTGEFKRACGPFDLQLNAAKTKWMAFLPDDPEIAVIDEQTTWSFVVDGETIEHVETFTYLGFDLDCFLTDKEHTAKIKDRLFKAARAVGQLMRDMKCSNLFSLRKYFVTLVLSQLYGLIFIDAKQLEVERAMDVFLKTAMGLPPSFPKVVASAVLAVKPTEVFQLEQRMKFLLKVENNDKSVTFDALVHDRTVLFPLHVGMNARLGDTLSTLDILPTIDYRANFQVIQEAQARQMRVATMSELLGASGRAFLCDIVTDGVISHDLRVVMAHLPFEQARIILLFFSDMHGWSSLCSMSKRCDCLSEFTSRHFFTCSRPFLSGREWTVFMCLAQAGAWLDLVELLFDVLLCWVQGTTLFKDTFRLHVTEFQPFPQPQGTFNPFRINV
jgi:hypothetical protein